MYNKTVQSANINNNVKGCLCSFFSKLAKISEQIRHVKKSKAVLQWRHSIVNNDVKFIVLTFQNADFCWTVRLCF